MMLKLCQQVLYNTRNHIRAKKCFRKFQRYDWFLQSRSHITIYHDDCSISVFECSITIFAIIFYQVFTYRNAMFLNVVHYSYHKG